MLRDFARDGRLRGSYGDAELTAPAENPVASEARTLHGDDNTN
jgi:hypothetical protein